MSDDLNDSNYPFSAHLGMRMTEWSEGYARFEMPLERFLLNRHGNLHGGAHATLLDTVMGYAGCWTGDANAPLMALTLSLNVQYLSRARGRLLTAEGRKTGGGRSTFFAEGEVRDETGEVLARGSAVFRYRRGGSGG